jgi:acyl-CoA thioesterase-1
MRFLGAVSFVLLSLALILGSVSCATSETPPQGNSSTDNTNTTNMSVYCMGDSLTYGVPTYNRYEDKLSSLLGAGWAVVNKGIGWQTTSQMLARFNADVLSHNPDWVIIWGGVNDVHTDVSAAAIESNLQSMYSQAHNAGIKVIAVSIGPFKPNAWTSTRQSVADSVNSWITNIATAVDFRIDVYSQLEDPSHPDQLLPAYDYGDHAHMTNAGYDLVGQTIYDGVNWNLE